MPDSPLTAIVVLLAALVVLRFQGWRALLVLRPQSVRVELETPADVTPIPPELEDAWATLQKLGFTLLGAHSEHPALGRVRLCLDGVHQTEPVVVSMWVGPDEQDQFELVTQSDRGFVVTANFRRIAREVQGEYLSGGLDGAAPERVLKAHLRRIPEIGTPVRLDTLERRVAAARTWYARSGKPELRQQHAVGLLWTLGALGMVGASLFRLLA